MVSERSMYDIIEENIVVSKKRDVVNLNVFEGCKCQIIRTSSMVGLNI